MSPQQPAGALARELESAHGRGVGAAIAGMQDPALGSVRLTGSAVAVLADAAVTSATPFLRAPLLARLSHVLVLHPPAGDTGGDCTTCGTPAPCPTARAVQP
ncbi:hypothetical protein [Arthrobacter mobilis]|uniref:Uncharacterized protein n=1 Tax=Arthrobacter mobilis TaxID=2724944 RepID=A0A7X6HE74_9MICC|nr:hypothetical protein [Arthrobacter mobilis]NKX54032.1 hypothetical protein [Arthrobacter mobilis]